MRRLSILIISALLILCSCRTVRKSTSSSTEGYRSISSHIESNVQRIRETMTYGDTLTAFIPKPDLNGPIRVPMRSTGIDQELVFTDSGVHVKTVAIPTSRTNTSEYESSSQSSTQEESVSTTESSEVRKKSRGIPWWLWTVAVVVIAAYVLYKLRRLIKIF